MQKLTKGLETKYKLATFLAIFTIAFEVIMEVLIPKIMANVIDVGIQNKDVDYVVKVGLLMIASSMASLFFGVIAARFASVASLGFGRNLRRNLFAKVQDFSFANIDHFSTSSLVTRLTTDVTNTQNTYQMIIRMCIRSPFMFISAIVMSFLINARLSLIFLVLIPIIALPAFFILKAAFPRFKELMKKYDLLNASVQENLIGIRAVKAFVREKSENEKFSHSADELRKAQLKAERIIIVAMPLMQLVTYLGIIAMLWFGGNMIIAGSLQTGELVSFITYLLQILFSLMMIAAIFVMMVISQASIKRIVEVLDTEIDLKDGAISETAREALELADGSIRFENVCFSYDNKIEDCVLNDINFEIESGSTVGIVGSTGSGKSSLVQLIPRLYDAFSGHVIVGGNDVKQYVLKTLRSQVAMVLQNNVLFSGTIRKNLLWGLSETSGETTVDSQVDIEQFCRIACAHDFIESFSDGYETELGQGGVNLSGGQKQRLCIARALIKRPKILILDDSTSAVDTATDAKIRAGLKTALPGTTKIIIAQRLSSIMDADKILVLDHGRIVAEGNHETLLKTCQIYQETYEMQIQDQDCDLEAN